MDEADEGRRCTLSLPTGRPQRKNCGESSSGFDYAHVVLSNGVGAAQRPNNPAGLSPSITRVGLTPPISCSSERRLGGETCVQETMVAGLPLVLVSGQQASDNNHQLFPNDLKPKSRLLLPWERQLAARRVARASNAFVVLREGTIVDLLSSPSAISASTKIMSLASRDQYPQKQHLVTRWW